MKPKRDILRQWAIALLVAFIATAAQAAYVSKARLASDLIPAVHSAVAGQRFVSPNLNLVDKP